MYPSHANRAHQTYLNNAVSTKSQGQLIIMLYEGAIKFIEQAQNAIEIGHIEEANKNLIKAQNILNELMVTLNFDAEEISNQLMSLYQFLYEQLIQANIKKDSGLLSSVKEILKDLSETWKKII